MSFPYFGGLLLGLEDRLGELDRDGEGLLGLAERTELRLGLERWMLGLVLLGLGADRIELDGVLDVFE
jgi:hypothetical protein